MLPNRSVVLFQVPTPGVRRAELRAFAHQLQTEVAGGRSFTALVTSDSELQRLNCAFRRKDRATDVLSFPASEDGDGFLGDIAISHQRACAQAAEQGHTAQNELCILMLHGVLHLIGMDHESDSGQMARAERLWRKRLKLGVGLIERTTA